MSQPDPAAHTPRRGKALAWLLVAALLALAALGAQRWLAARDALAQDVLADRQRIAALEQRLDAMRRNQRAQTTRLQQAEATNRLLREELIGLGQRAALLEDSLRKLADPALQAGQALRLDEIELLLAQGQQRLLLAGDLEGARRAYALAGQLSEGLSDHAWLDLRQALAQERAALEALGEDPRGTAGARLARLASALPALPQAPAPAATPASPPSPWRRALAGLVQVQPSATALATDPADRAPALAALQLELGLAQAAVERRDRDTWQAALARADAWVLRLWPDSAARRSQLALLRELREQDLALDLPELGSTLTRLRRQRGG
jgi:uroporphyrin-3 C-methyltransferase